MYYKLQNELRCVCTYYISFLHLSKVPPSVCTLRNTDSVSWRVMEFNITVKMFHSIFYSLLVSIICTKEYPPMRLGLVPKNWVYRDRDK